MLSGWKRDEINMKFNLGIITHHIRNSTTVFTKIHNTLSTAYPLLTILY